MELALFIYLASVFSKVNFVLEIIGWIGLVFIAIYIIYCIDTGNTVNKIYCSLPCIALFIAMLLPSERTMYMMAGGYFAQEIITSETSSKVKALIDAKLDEYILELKHSEKK